MQKIKFNDLEVEIVKKIKKWRDEMVKKYGSDSTLGQMDAGDAVDLASDIVLEVIAPGIEIVGEYQADRRLSEGWE